MKPLYAVQWNQLLPAKEEHLALEAATHQYLKRDGVVFMNISF